MALGGWGTSHALPAHPPFQSQSGVRGYVPAPFGAGESCTGLPIAPLFPPKIAPTLPERVMALRGDSARP